MLQLVHVQKTYTTSEVETSALADVSLDVAKGEFVAVTGPSGCGKSTLLTVLGLMDSLSSGSYLLMGEDVGSSSEARFTELRRKHFGFVFQHSNLIDSINVVENVAVGLIYRTHAARAGSRAMQALEQVGIAHRARHLPAQLSGGQQQRVAIARAIAAGPDVIFADEPTGSLDTHNGNEVMRLLNEINQAGTTIVMVTHSDAHANQAHRVVRMLDGRVVS